MHDPDDFPDYRHGSAAPSWPTKQRQPRRPDLSEREQRARYATAIARAELGRFYWNGKRHAELEAAMKRPRKQDGRNSKSR